MEGALTVASVELRIATKVRFCRTIVWSYLNKLYLSLLSPGTKTAKLCLVILNCIVEDQYANAFLHDANMTFTVPIYKMNLYHRKGKQWGVTYISKQACKCSCECRNSYKINISSTTSCKVKFSPIFSNLLQFAPLVNVTRAARGYFLQNHFIKLASLSK